VSQSDEEAIAKLNSEIAALRQEVERHRQYQSLLANVEAVANQGVWEWIINQESMYWSKGLFRIFGESPGEVEPTFARYLSKFVPEDRARVQEMMMRALSEGISFSHDERILRSDGSAVYLHILGYATLDPFGRPSSLVGVCQDVTKQKSLEAAVHRGERIRQLMFDTVGDVLFYLKVHQDSGKFEFLSANQSFLDATGLAESEVVGKFVEEVIPEPSLQVVLANYRRAIEEKRAIHWDEVTVYPAGRKVGEVSVTPLFDSDGRCSGLVGAVHDVTERKEAEERLQEAVSLQHATIESTADGILVVDQNGRIIDYNRKLLEIWRLPEAAVKSKSYEDAINEVFDLLEEPEECVRRLAEILQNVNADSFDVLRFKDGTVMERHSRPQKIDGKTIGRVFSYRDISARARVERELKESETRKSAILDSALDSIITMDHEGKIREFNGAAETQFGYRANEAVGRDLADLIIPERLRDRHRRGLAHYLATGEGPILGRRMEQHALRRDGSEFPAEISIVVVRPAGVPLFTGFIRDVSERVRYQEELEKSVSILRGTLESTADGLLVLNRRGRITHFNKKMSELWQVPEGVLVSMDGRGLIALIKGKLKQPRVFLRAVLKLQADPMAQHRGSVELSNGRILEWYSQPQRIDQNYVGRVWSFRDMTDAILAESRIRLQTDRLKFLADASLTFAQARLELQPLLSTVARRTAEFLQEGCVIRLISADKGSLDVVAYHHVNPELLLEMQHVIPRGFRLIDDQLAAQLIATGKPVSVSATKPEVMAKVRAEFWPTLERFPVHSWVAIPMRVGGQVTGIITFFRYKPGAAYSPEEVSFLQDLADRAALAIENAKLYSESRSAVHLREEFIMTASHELRTPLTPLKAQLQLLTMSIRTGAIVPGKAKKAAEVLSLISSAESHVSKMIQLVEEMLDAVRMASRGVSLSIVRTDLSSLVRDAVDRLRKELEAAKCPLELSIEPLIVGNWDRFRIEQIVINLLTNAMKFGAGRPIRIELSREDGHAKLVVRDFGIGVIKEDQARIFEPFERAVSVKRFGGLGLGLYIVRQLVEAHGGKVRVVSSPDQGTAFTVELPFASPIAGGFTRKWESAA